MGGAGTVVGVMDMVEEVMIGVIMVVVVGRSCTVEVNHPSLCFFFD